MGQRIRFAALPVDPLFVRRSRRLSKRCHLLLLHFMYTVALECLDSRDTEGSVCCRHPPYCSSLLCAMELSCACLV